MYKNDEKTATAHRSYILFDNERDKVGGAKGESLKFLEIKQHSVLSMRLTTNKRTVVPLKPSGG